MRKIYKKLWEKDINEGVVFSSCLSMQRTEQLKDTIHKVYKTEPIAEQQKKIMRLKDDSFFNKSPFYKYNIIRTL